MLIERKLDLACRFLRNIQQYTAPLDVKQLSRNGFGRDEICVCTVTTLTGGYPLLPMPGDFQERETQKCSRRSSSVT
jgi:hypothetical protein